MTLIIMNIALSIMFISLSHPLSLGLILLIQTTLISLMSGNFCFNFWFSYILFLVMIGGMLILFIYMTSIASNEKFMFSLKSLAPLMITLNCIMIPILILFISDSPINNNMTTFKVNYMSTSMIKYTYLPMNMVFTFMIIYLFIALIAIVKIIDTKSGPLRSKY
uniref:NADH dehydrogenase subunit 6 n=1 Tax=Berberomeloe castuo TaxID=2705017 RepID=UPI001FA74972|nr:NADH dehydrogenase subunit 6 [Berberomeloe castuo]UMR54818.1 NADH dehydrogenase subunit 6 [Berberomeloe castuo]